MTMLRDLWKGATDAAGDTWQKMPTGMKVALGAGGTLLAAKALLPKNLLLSSALLRAGRETTDNERLIAAGYDPSDLPAGAGFLYDESGARSVSGSGLSDNVPVLLFPLSESLQAFELGQAIKRRSVISPWDSMAVISGDPGMMPRVPLVFIDSHGDLVDDPRLYIWALPNVLQGGLFSKLGTGLKKVASKALPAASKLLNFIPGVGPIASTIADAGAKLLTERDKGIKGVADDAAKSPGALSILKTIAGADAASGKDTFMVPEPAASASAAGLGLSSSLPNDPDYFIPQENEVGDYATIAAEDRDILPAEIFDEGSGLVDPRSSISQETMLGFVPTLLAAGRWVASIGSLAWPWIRRMVLNKQFLTSVKTMLFNAGKHAGTSAGHVLKFIGPKALIGASAIFYFVRKGSQKQQEELHAAVSRYLEGDDRDRWQRIYEHDIKKRLTVFSKKEQEEAATLVAKSVLACAAQASLPTANDQVKKDYAIILDTVDAMKKENPKSYSELEILVNGAVDEMHKEIGGSEAIAAASFSGSQRSPQPYDAGDAATAALLSPSDVPADAPSQSVTIDESSPESDSDDDTGLRDALLKIGVPAAMITGIIALIKSQVAGKKADDAYELRSEQSQQSYIPIQL